MNVIQITELCFKEDGLIRKCSGFVDSVHKVGHKVFSSAKRNVRPNRCVY